MHRSCIVLRGQPAETAARASALIPEGATVLWVSERDPSADERPEGWSTIARSRVKTLLGAAFDVVVLELHLRIDPDVLGVCHGSVWGGGAMILRLPPQGQEPTELREGLIVWPFGPQDVGTRFFARLCRHLEPFEGPPPSVLLPAHTDRLVLRGALSAPSGIRLPAAPEPYSTLAGPISGPVGRARGPADPAEGTRGPADPAGSPADPVGSRSRPGTRGPADPAESRSRPGTRGAADLAGSRSRPGTRGPADPAGSRSRPGTRGPADPAGSRSRPGTRGPADRSGEPAGRDGLTADQQHAIEVLAQALGSAPGPGGSGRASEPPGGRAGSDPVDGQPPVVVLTSDRGRGKSSALGLALARLPASLRIAVTGPGRAAVAEVLRFAPRRCGFSPLEEVLEGEGAVDVLVVDEAAQVPVPVLQALVVRHPRAAIALATTTRGYEGTGRGFVLRFLAWIEASDRPVHRLSLAQPVRWSAGDPLEALIFRALALDAAPAPIAQIADCIAEEACATELSRDRLLGDEQLLGDVFGLLVHAHYRTTPRDLHALLDGPNLSVHALLWRGRAVAATLVAREGGLPEAISMQLALGGRRIRGHALPETLCCHAGLPEAGALQVVRSVRIAVHPGLRRRGLASRLVQHVHDHATPDLFGTMFSATSATLRFRRQLGYALIRVGSSRGGRTGEPSAVMARAGSPRGEQLIAYLRGRLAAELPLQLRLLAGEGPVPLSPELIAELQRDGAEPIPLDPEAIRRAVVGYAFGPRTHESAAAALAEFVQDHRPQLAQLTPEHRALIEARVLQLRPWRQLARQRGVAVPVVMRALGRAVRALALAVDPGLRPG